MTHCIFRHRCEFCCRWCRTEASWLSLFYKHSPALCSLLFKHLGWEVACLRPSVATAQPYSLLPPFSGSSFFSWSRVSPAHIVFFVISNFCPCLLKSCPFSTHLRLLVSLWRATTSLTAPYLLRTLCFIDISHQPWYSLFLFWQTDPLQYTWRNPKTIWSFLTL